MKKLVVIFLCALLATQIHAGSEKNARKGSTSFADDRLVITNKEHEILSAIAAVNVLDSEDVSIILQAGAGSSKARADEITKKLQATRKGLNFYVTDETKAQARKLIQQAHAVLDAQKDYHDMDAISKSWKGKSITIEGHQLGPAIVKAGLLLDVYQATNALKSKIGLPAYIELANNAQREIDASASSLLTGNDRDALAGFLMLEAVDPVAAAEIFNRAVSPTTSSGFNRQH